MTSEEALEIIQQLYKQNMIMAAPKTKKAIEKTIELLVVDISKQKMKENEKK